MTLDEWYELPEDDEGELVDGRLEEEEVPTILHEATVAWLIATLYRWLRPRKGWVFGSEGKYAVGPRTGRKPDATVYLAGSKFQPRGLVRTPPDLVIEVLTDTARDRRRDRIDKAREYATFGVKLYMMIDPEARSVEVLQLALGRARQRRKWTLVVTATNGIVRLPGFDGLELDLDEIWNQLDDILEMNR